MRIPASRKKEMASHCCTGPGCGCAGSPGRNAFVRAVCEGIIEPARISADLAETPLRDDFDQCEKSAQQTPRRVLIKGATILSMDSAIGDFAVGDILIEGSKIAAVGPCIEAEAAVVDASEMIALPGFCDPHIHAWEGNLPRLIPDNTTTAEEERTGKIKGERPTRNYRWVYHQLFGPLYRPEDVYIGTLASLLAAMNGGITTVCDNAHNLRTSAHADASVAALKVSGVRGIHAHARPRDGEYEMRFPDDAERVKREHFASDDQLTTMRLYLLGRDPYEELERVVQMRRRLDCWITFDSGIGSQPLAELYRDGLLDGRETINHGNFVSREKMEAVAAAGAQVNVCPRIETQFRYGEVPYQEWRNVGVRPAISNDDPGTYAINMFSEMQALYAFQRSRALQAKMDPGHLGTPELTSLREILQAATIRGAENCALAHKVGTLTPGKEADIVLINTDSVHLYPRHNAVCTVVQGAGVDSVDTVFIGGRLVKWHGRLIGLDMKGLRRAIDASRDYLFAAADWPHGEIDVTD